MLFFEQKWTHLLVEMKKENQLWLTLNQPEQSNAISIEMVESLTQVLRQAERDPSVRVIVLTGAGKSFCAGGDLHAMKNKTGMFAGAANELRERYMHGIQQIPLTIEALSKPLIAMVQGPAVGAGCDMAMMCDLRIGSAQSRFAETFARLGLVPGDGGTFFLTRAIGYAKALQMFMTGDFCDGQSALEAGLLHYLVPAEDLIQRTEELAKKVASNAPIALQMTKKAMKLSYLHDLQSSLDLLASFQGIAQRTDDHFAALEAFEKKQPAKFQGK